MSAGDGKSRSAAALLDWFLLPLLGLFTFVLLTYCLEWSARHIFNRSETTIWSCLVVGDDATPLHAIPNSACKEKLPESPLVEYRYNACGHRSEAVCGPKPTGSFRIVLVGSSVIVGNLVPFERTIAVLLKRELNRTGGRVVDIDNQGMGLGTPRSVDLRFSEALAASPDMILWGVTPWDIEHAAFLHAPADPTAAPRPRPTGATRFVKAFREGRLREDIRDWWITKWNSPDTLMLLQHTLFLSQSQFIRNTLSEPDVAGFLLKNQPPVWNRHWQEFDTYAADLASRSKAAGIPFCVTAIPNRADASLVSAGEWPPEVDPYLFASKVRSLSESHGAVYLDVLSSFSKVPAAESLYYPVDEHLNADGAAVVAGFLAEKLSGQIRGAPYREPGNDFESRRGVKTMANKQ
jgi:hypothetical protein